MEAAAGAESDPCSGGMGGALTAAATILFHCCLPSVHRHLAWKMQTSVPWAPAFTGRSS